MAKRTKSDIEVVAHPEQTPKQRKPRKQKEAVQSIAKVEKQSAQLSLSDPGDVMAFGKTLKSYIEQNQLSVTIERQPYAMVDGWKFAGINFGLTAIPGVPIPKHQPGQYITILYAMKEFKTKDKKPYSKEVPVFAGFADHTAILDNVRGSIQVTKEMTKPYFAYECTSEIVRISDGTRVSAGTGLCSNLELGKISFDEYAVNSMCQTRSIGKAYRNLIGFVMKSAGFESTPAEEMDEVKETHNQDMSNVPLPPVPGPDRFKMIVERFRAGDITTGTIQKHFTLTDEQKKELDKIDIHKTSDARIIPDQETFKALCKDVMSKQAVIKDLISRYSFTEDQLKSLELMEKQAQKKA